MSDHFPISSRVVRQGASRETQVIPRWMADSAAFVERVVFRFEEAMRLDRFRGLSALEALEVTKSLAHAASQDVLLDEDVGKNSTPKAIHWTKALINAVASNSGRIADLALRKHRKLLEFVSSTGWQVSVDGARVEQYYLDLLNTFSAEEIQKQEQVLTREEVSEQAKVVAQRQCARLYRQRREFAPLARRLRIGGIVSAGGAVITEPICCVNAVEADWASPFAHKAGSVRIERDIHASYCIPLRSEQWEIDEATFLAVVERAKDCAVGPDGIPGAVWRSLPYVFKKRFFLCL